MGQVAGKPVPGPHAGFNLRVLEQRPVDMPAEALQPDAMAPEALADVLPALGPAQLALMASRLKRRAYAAGAVIVREGDVADNFYILMEGEVWVQKRTAEGGVKEGARLEAGTYFGEIGLLHGVARTATIQAVTPVKVLVLDRETFVAIVAEADLTSAEIARVVRQRYISAHLAAALPSLASEALGGLLADVASKRYPDGEVIFRQGEAAETFYIISRGRVEVINHHPAGRDILLAQQICCQPHAQACHHARRDAK